MIDSFQYQLNKIIAHNYHTSAFLAKICLGSFCREQIKTKTYHLEGSQVLLPPDVFAHNGTHRSQHVVGIHDNMDEGVEKAKEGGVSTGREFDAEPNGHRHHAVVDHVQGRYVVELLP